MGSMKHLDRKHPKIIHPIFEPHQPRGKLHFTLVRTHINPSRNCRTSYHSQSPSSIISNSLRYGRAPRRTWNLSRSSFRNSLLSDANSTSQILIGSLIVPHAIRESHFIPWEMSWNANTATTQSECATGKNLWPNWHVIVMKNTIITAMGKMSLSSN